MRALSIRVSRSASVIVLYIGSGCAGYKPASDRLPESQDLAALPGSGGADWTCLNAVVPDRPRTPGTPGAPIVYSLQLVDLATQLVLSNATVRACGLTDIACDNPLTAQLTPGPDGWVNVPLTENFAGYLEIVSPGDVPYIFQLSDTGLRTMRDFPVVMISLQSFVALQATVEVTPDPKLAAIAARTFDCKGVPAAGVVLKSNMGGLPYYFESGLPTLAGTQTDEDGLGGFIATPTAVTLLQANLLDGTRTASQSIVMRGNWMTVVYLRPPRVSTANDLTRQ